MPIRCSKDDIARLLKTVRLMRGTSFKSKVGGLVTAGQTLSLNDNKRTYQVYILHADSYFIYYLDWRDKAIYYATAEEDTFSGTSLEAVTTGGRNAVGSAIMAKFMVEFSIGLIAGGAFGRLGVLAVGIASTTDMVLRYGKDFDKIYDAITSFLEGHRLLRAVAPNFADLLENVVFNSFMHELPGAFGDSIVEIFTDPESLATLIGTIIGVVGKDAALRKLGRVTIIIKVVIKEVLKEVLGKLTPGKDMLETLATAGGQGLKLGTAKAKAIAESLKKALDLASGGATVYIIGGVRDVNLADVVREIATYPKEIAYALQKIDRAVSAIPDDEE